MENLGKVEIKIIRSDKKEFLIDDKLFRVPNGGLKNWANLEYDVAMTENVTMDGGTVHSMRVPSIDREITARLQNKNLNNVMRKTVISFFNPRYMYDVYLTYGDRTLWCSGAQIGFECENDNLYTPLEFTWTILCPSPFLKSVENFGRDIAGKMPMFGFPYVSHLARPYGFLSGKYNFAREVVLENNGDVETYCRAVMVFGGEVVNPRIEKDGKFVRIIDTMKKDDVVEIDFTVLPPVVLKNGQNIVQKTDRLSNFVGMNFDVGKNTIKHNADNGSDNMSVSVYYNKLFLGV